jgi:hypothetical protein
MGENLQAEVDLVTTLWQVPWEQDRLRRLVRGAYAGGPAGFKRALTALPHSVGLVVNRRFSRHLEVWEQSARCRLRASLLLVALRLYQAEKGKSAESLQALVEARYLTAIPKDPYDGQPFRYRLSRGNENIDRVLLGGGLAEPGAEPAKPIPVSANQGILWSVGEDKHDDGGRKQGGPHSAADEDWIFVVPLPRHR